MINNETNKNELLGLRAKEYDFSGEVVSSIPTEEELIVSNLYQTTNIDGYGQCDMYEVYENVEDSDSIVLAVDKTIDNREVYLQIVYVD